MRSVSILILASALLALSGVPGWAFHDHGVANCGSCHILHDSQDGMSVAIGGTGEALLRVADPTDLCLSCHAETLGEVLGYSPTNPPAERGPGNFVFLLEDNLNDASMGFVEPIPGERAGHNVSSISYGIQPDILNALSPGGNYPSQQLGCVSCHDPHGTAGFRMLYGGQQSTPDGFFFLYDAPSAQGLSDFAGQESPVAHTAYRSGWSEWCANCHGFYHESGISPFQHPVSGQLASEEASVYNQYAGDADPTGGSYASAYLPEVPLQDPAATPGSTSGAGGSSEISCMSCHRAHATSAPHALRWDPMVLSLGEDGVSSGSWPIPNPYLDPDQRSLCLKCHEVFARTHHDNRPCMDCHGGTPGPGPDPLAVPDISEP